MIPVKLLLYVAGGGIELISLIICINIIGVLRNDHFGIIKIILSSAADVFLLTLAFFTPSLNIPFKMPSIILFYLSFFAAIFILYGHINLGVIYLVAVLDFSISLIKTNICFILTNITEIGFDDISLFVMMFIQIITFFLILLARRKEDIKRITVALALIPKHIYILLISAIGLLHLLSSLISYKTDKIIFKDILLMSLFIFLMVIMLFIVASLISNVIAKQHFAAVSQMMEKQVELQINHYKELEKMNTEISKFRHDYTNHLQSILSLVQMEECSQAEEYILKLKKVKYGSDRQMFYTGNKLADAILSGKSSALDENCRIDYSGIIPSSIENVDLCIILSNALDNAIEACRQLTDPSTISIYAAEQQGYFVMSIGNPTICTENYYDIPPTAKANKEFHGLGLHNIENAVKKYGGQMKIKCENRFFELMLTMKI